MAGGPRKRKRPKILAREKAPPKPKPTEVVASASPATSPAVTHSPQTRDTTETHVGNTVNESVPVTSNYSREPDNVEVTTVPPSSTVAAHSNDRTATLSAQSSVEQTFDRNDDPSRDLDMYAGLELDPFGKPRLRIRDYMRNHYSGRPMESKLKNKKGRRSRKKKSATSDDDAGSPSTPASESAENSPRSPPQPEETEDINDGGADIQFINGKIVVVEKEIEVGERERPLNAGSQAAIRSEDSFTTSASFKARDSAERWTIAETRKFYHGLKQCGTDFSMLSMLFPRRTRKQIKRKFKREEKRNPALVAQMLENREQIDLEKFTGSSSPASPVVAKPVPDTESSSTAAGAATASESAPSDNGDGDANPPPPAKQTRPRRSGRSKRRP